MLVLFCKLCCGSA